jgi:predicted nuclease of predicted toxin-antitoxin system
VKLLVDENLPPRIAALLVDVGHDAVHVRDLDAPGASGPEIIALALADARTIISADTDFGALLAATGATDPSVILVREVIDRRPPDLVELLVSCLEQLEPQLQAGAMVAVTPSGFRVRRLPLR